MPAAEGPTPEVRLDQLTGLRTILAPARADRPIDFVNERPAAKPENCPFCEGTEDRTPQEVWADRPGGGPADSPGWRVRAVPNLYPALAQSTEGEAETGDGLSAEGDPLRAAARAGLPDLFRAVPASGYHEVIVHSPEHRASIGELTDDELAASVAGWRTRMRAHDEAAYVQLIVNDGHDAGASRDHSHAQLYALGFVPAAIARERERFVSYNQQTMGGDLLADIASEEVRRRERLVAIDDEALLICPWASRGPFELRVIPRTPAGSFEDDGEVGTAMIGTALRALTARFGELPQLNLWVITAPGGADQFHWHLDIAPRIGIRAGFEMSTGVDLNIFPPERAASELREALGTEVGKASAKEVPNPYWELYERDGNAETYVEFVRAFAESAMLAGLFEPGARGIEPSELGDRSFDRLRELNAADPESGRYECWILRLVVERR